MGAVSLGWLAVGGSARSLAGSGTAADPGKPRWVRPVDGDDENQCLPA